MLHVCVLIDVMQDCPLKVIIKLMSYAQLLKHFRQRENSQKMISLLRLNCGCYYWNDNFGILLSKVTGMVYCTCVLPTEQVLEAESALPVRSATQWTI